MHFKFLFYPSCSAFHNISVAAVIWLGLIKIETLRFLRSDWCALAAMIGATILLIMSPYQFDGSIADHAAILA